MDNRTFRDAMGKFATGITIVSTEYKEEIIGMTVNAFMSISLNPKLIAISIDESASLYKQFKETTTFGVSILKEEQKEISMILAKQIKKDREINFITQDHVPVIDDSLAMLSCRVQDRITAGDHLIIIAEVTELTINEGEPILYSGGAYRNIKPI